MRCYYHADAEGVALCKHCYRALCRECAADTGAGMACRGRCEEQVRVLGRVMEASEQLALGTHGTHRQSLLFYFLFGGLFVVGAAGVHSLVGSRGWPATAFLLAAGLVIIGFGIANYRSWRAQSEASSRS